ncbi:MAG TPA: HEAT repeat domain-containing protein [Kiritimatiellia bacterium]|nr:HEAT repeat domain-containing protein [Kiritimatiellia bacterium]
MRRTFVFCLLIAASVLNAFAGATEDRSLFQAISSGDKAAVERALKYGANPNAKMMGGKTAVQLAEQKGLTDIVAILKQSGSSDVPSPAPVPKPEPVAKPVAAPAPAPAPAAVVPPVPAVQVKQKEAIEEKVAPPAPVVIENKPKPEPAPAAVLPAPVVAATPEPAPLRAAPPAASADLQKLLDQKILQNNYNAIVVDFLVGEGRNSLAPAQRKEALDQLVAALKAKTQVSKDDQLYTALGALTGMGMGAMNDDIISDAGSDVESSYASEYASWVNAAFKLVHAGYPEDAADFFEYGLQYIPYPGIKAQCVKGLAVARPGKAFDFLMSQTAAPGIEEQNVALRLLGWLAADPNLPDDKRQAIIDKLTEFSQGMLHASNYGAAIYGLDVAHDKGAIPALSRFKGGLGISSEDKRPALRSLLLTYGDTSVLDILRGMTKGGLMTLNNPWDNLYAATALIQYGDQNGFDWADRTLAKTKKGFMDAKDAPDQRPETVRILVKYGGEKGRAILAQNVDKYQDSNWLKTWIATGMLELGDKSKIDLVRASLSNPEWDYTAVRITEALAKHGDYSGLTALRQLIEKRPPQKSTGMAVLGALAGKKDNTAAEKRRLENLRIQIANALARINRPECVPLLKTLLLDEDPYVRSSAALALTEVTTPDALDGLRTAMEIDYGMVNKTSRNPEIYAHIARMAAMRFPGNPQTAEILNKAGSKPYPAVQFLSAVLRNGK